MHLTESTLISWGVISVSVTLVSLTHQGRDKMAAISQTKFPLWRHQMETFSALLAICAGNSPVPGEFPHKGQWRGVLAFSLICTRINGWVNNGEAGDLRHHRAHYDATVMQMHFLGLKRLNVKYNFIELCSLGSNWQYAIISWAKALAPHWRQAFIWTNDGLVYWRIYVSLSRIE